MSFIIPATISLTKTGQGALTLSGSSSFSGGTTLSAGTLNINNDHALGVGALIITGGVLDNTSGSAVTNVAVNQAWNANFTFKGSNDLSFEGGSVTMSSSRVVTVSAGDLTVGGISATKSPAGLTKTGSGTLTVVGESSYNGVTKINAGTLVIGESDQPVLLGLTTTSDGLYVWGRNTKSYGSLASKKVIDKGTLAFNRSGTLSFSSAISGTGGVRQDGTGTVTLTGANNYTGHTIVNAGRLEAGSLKALGKSDVMLNGGELAAGGTSHRINIAGDLIWNSDARIALTLNDDASLSDFVRVAGSFDMLGDGRLTFDLSTGSTVGVGSFLVMKSAKGFGDLTADDFDFISDDPNLIGSFRIVGKNLYFDSELVIAVGPSFPPYIVFNVVPEPSTWALLGLGAGLALWHRMRRFA